MIKILVIEDEVNLNNIVCDYLSSKYKMYTAFDGEKGLKIFNKEKIDLVILDIMLPKKNGYKVLEEIRTTSDVLVILLTALETEENKLKGFELGADEYITKPFSPRVLVAIVDSLLKRNNKILQEKININDLIIDTQERKVIKQDKTISLTKTEFDLLILLIKNVNRVLDREIILNKNWGYNYFGDSRVVDTNIKNLRRKLGKNNNIETVIGIGYKYVEKN